MRTNAALFERNFRELTAGTSVNFVFIGLEQHLHIIRSDFITEGEGVTSKVWPLSSYITARQCILLPLLHKSLLLWRQKKDWLES